MGSILFFRTIKSLGEKMIRPVQQTTVQEKLKEQGSGLGLWTVSNRRRNVAMYPMNTVSSAGGERRALPERLHGMVATLSPPPLALDTHPIPYSALEKGRK